MSLPRKARSAAVAESRKLRPKVHDGRHRVRSNIRHHKSEAQKLAFLDQRQRTYAHTRSRTARSSCTHSFRSLQFHTAHTAPHTPLHGRRHIAHLAPLHSFPPRRCTDTRTHKNVSPIIRSHTDKQRISHAHHTRAPPHEPLLESGRSVTQSIGLGGSPPLPS